ncbi:MAG: AMP-binding protein [Bacteroidota bacterium]
MEFNSIVHLLNHRASTQPEQLAYAFYNSKGEVVKEHHHASLARSAQQWAALIRSRVAPRERVILMFPAGLEFIEAFIGCLYAGAVPVPAYPPRKNANALRIASIVQDAQIRLALTTPNEAQKLAKMQEDYPFLAGLDYLAPGADVYAAEPLPASEQWPHTPEDLAFLQYTSGSTGNPKGVMVGNDNLMINIDIMHRHTPFHRGHRMVSWLPAFHDMGLIYGILLPLYSDCPCFLMAPVTFVTRPLTWFKVIDRVRGTHTVSPNFAFDLCVAKIKPEDLADLDLSCIQSFANAAEPIRQKSIDRFLQLVDPSGAFEEKICGAYGLAEATLLLASSDLTKGYAKCWVSESALSERKVEFVSAETEGALAQVGSGKLAADVDVRIVDPVSLRQCATDEVGEIWVRGSTVARGYWQNEAATNEIFRARTGDTDEGPFLRTGDLGFIRDGEIFLTGRWKDLIIVEGVNYYPHDIEYLAQQLHPALIENRGAAFAHDFGQGEQLVLVHEVDPRRLSENTEEALQQLALATYEMLLDNYGFAPQEIVLVKKSSVPMTSSGKVRRRPCRQMYLEDSLPVLARYRPSTRTTPAPRIHSRADLEAYVLQNLAHIFKMQVSDIDVESSPVDLGLDSIAAMEFRSRFQRDFNWKVNLTDLLYKHTIRSLIDQLYEHLQTMSSTPAEPAESPTVETTDVDQLNENELDQLIASLESDV